jgi:DNA mismatch repair protein MutS2
MNAHSLKILEFDRLLDLIAGYARSESGRAAVRAIRPQPDPEATAEDARLFGEALALRRAGVDLPAAAFDDPAAALLQAAPVNAVLDPEGFRLIHALLDAAAVVRRFALSDRCDASAALQALGRGLEPCEALVRRMDATFEPPEGRVADRASDALRRVRTRIAAVERSLEARLQRMLGEDRLAGAFQDEFVTRRHGRYVLPVRREMRSAIKGIVHDQSNTGETLFIEPEDLVEPGNELELLRLEERNEIRRILAALTDDLRAESEPIRATYAQLCRFDAACAVSAWAVEYDCRPLEPGDRLHLVSARHPLLDQRLRLESRSDRLVPLDFLAPEGRNVVVITGSNTGGKTVALRTVGLLTLMTQAGLPVPAAAGSGAPFYDDVLADIGDEQSIEQSLSTFSAHLRNIVGMLAAARGARVLVLMDELGAGTDPVEGGALSCAILDALSRTAGLTVATTHLGSVKRFVHDHPAMENAAMLFDVETLRPCYRLLMGQAGASYALAIAERCGIPGEITEAARGLLGEEDRHLERMLSALDSKHLSMERQLKDTAQAREEAERARERAERDRAEAERQLRSLHVERRRVLHEAQGEATTVLAGARRDADRILSEAQRANAPEQARALRREAAEKEQSLRAAREATRERPEPGFAAGELKMGDRVWSPLLNDHGVVEALHDGGERASVRVGNLRMDVRRSDLGRPRQPEAAPRRTAPPLKTPPAPRHPPREINLIGERVDPALRRLARFFDDALLAGVEEIRIVHGYGTGALEQAVHAFLREAGVRRFRLGRAGEDPGGAGVTWVTL